MTENLNNPAASAFERRRQAGKPANGGPDWTTEKSLPADVGWPEHDAMVAARFAKDGLVDKRRKNTTARANVESDLQNEKREYPKRAAEALRGGKPAPADKTEALTAKLRDLNAERVIIDMALKSEADEIAGNAHAHRDEYHAASQQLEAEALDEADDALAVLVAAVDRVHRVRAADNWLMGDKFVAAGVGSKHVNGLADDLAKAREYRAPVLYVDPKSL